jgi:hypothetical protein
MQDGTTIEKGTAALAQYEADELRRWFERDGEAVVVAQSGLSRLTLARAAARLAIHAGSRAAVRLALARRRAA